MRRVIGVVSGKGGVGKTVTAANLALAMQEMGKQVVCIDADVTASNLALQLDMHPNPEITLQDALEGKVDVLKTITLHDTGLMLIPSSLALEQEGLDREKFKRLLDRLSGYVIIDAPPGLNEDVHTIIDVSDELLIVTNPEIPAVADAMRVAEAIRRKKGEEAALGIVLTKSENASYEVSEREIESATELPILVKVPHDRETKKSIASRIPLVHYNPHAKAAIEYRRLAAIILGEDYKPPFFAPIRRLFNWI